MDAFLVKTTICQLSSFKFAPDVIAFWLLSTCAAISLPIILKSVQGLDQTCDRNLKALFPNFENAPKELENFFRSLDVSTNFKDYIGNANDWDLIVKDAFGGERGKNFIGNYKKVLEAQEFLGY